MRILHMDTGREMRGGQWQVLRLIEGLAGAGMESTLLARKGSPLFEAARKGGWRVEPFGVVRTLRLARSHDLIHAHDARSHTVGALVGSRRLIVSRRVAFAVGSTWKYGRARRYIAVSEFVKQVLMAGGVPESKIAVVYDGVPILGEAAGDLVLAPANADDAQKGAVLAVEAAGLAGAPLVLTRELELDLRRTAIFVYISYSEGLGSAVLLAMSAGVAVVASNTGGLREVIRDGIDGLLVENRVEAIAAGIRELRENPARARAMGLAARERVRAGFTIGEMVQRTMDVYGQAVG